MSLYRRIFLRSHASWHHQLHARHHISIFGHQQLQHHHPRHAKKCRYCGSIVRDNTIGSSNKTTTIATTTDACPQNFNDTESQSVVRNRNDETKQQRPRRPIRIVVAMSGGVDSSVAAHLLLRQQRKQENHSSQSSEVMPNVEVMGLHMSNWNALDEDSDEDVHRESKQKTSIDSKNEIRHPSSNYSYNDNNNKSGSTTSTSYCEASEKEYHDALSVAKHLSIPLHRVSFASEYWIQVFEPFVESIIHQQQQQKQHHPHEQAETNDSNGHIKMLNPDFGCNTYIKFGTMKEYAMDRLHADYVATGHYARLWHRNHYATLLEDKGRDFYHWMEESSRLVGNSVIESISDLPEEEWILHNCNINNKNDHTTSTSLHSPMLISGADSSKDQSYFLSGVKTEAFRNVIFPLGHLMKSDAQNDTSNSNSKNNRHLQSVRELARTANIPTATKRDSMGICFIGQRNFGNFISQYLPENMITTSSSSAVTGTSESSPRIFVDIDTGKVLGHHRGMMYYTLGQGAKIPGVFVRYFVCGKGGGQTGDSNTIYVCNSTHHPALYTDELYVDFDSFNWIGLGGNCSIPPRPLIEGHPIRLLARTRHLQPLAPCTVSWEPSSYGKKGSMVVHFDNPIRAITPGQVVALYAGREGLICLGGGVILSAKPSFFERGKSVSLADLHPSGHNDLSLLKYRSNGGLQS